MNGPTFAEYSDAAARTDEGKGREADAHTIAMYEWLNAGQDTPIGPPPPTPLASAFAPDEVEALLVTLAECLDGVDPDDMSERQRELARRLTITWRGFDEP